MDEFMSHPLANRKASSDVADLPGYRDGAISSALPTTEEEWKCVLRNNTSCLKGVIVSRQGGIPEMAQYTAFEFNYDPSKGPEHVQDEKTKIEVKKIESERQQESVHIGIAEQEIDLLLKTVAADNRLKLGIRHASHKEQNRSSKVKKLEVSHCHPKFVVFLDERSLAITKDCQYRLNQLKQSDEKRQAVAFLEDYGEGFAIQVTIGGRLFHSENVSNLEGRALENRENSLHLAAESSLSVADSSKPNSMHSNIQTMQKDSTNSTSASEGMFWCGIGGDPCLHGEAWIASLKKNKTTWKIIEKKLLKQLPSVLGRFSGFEWVPAKFEQLLRPTPPRVLDMTLFEESQIGHSSFALMRKSGWSDLENGLVFFQDTAGCIKYGCISLRSEPPISDILFVDTIAHALPNTPLLSVSTGHRNCPSLIYVSEDGCLAGQFWRDYWRPNCLTDLKLQVASYSNISIAEFAGFTHVCFEDPSGNLCFINEKDKEVEYLNQAVNVNITPGSALDMRIWQSRTGIFSITFYRHIVIAFQDREGRLLAVERKTEWPDRTDTGWVLSEILAPPTTQHISFKPWTRNKCLVILREDLPPQIEDLFSHDESGLLIHHSRDISGHLVKDREPVCQISVESYYACTEEALVYMSASGQLECTILHPGLAGSRAILQRGCRQRRHYEASDTLWPKIEKPKGPEEPTGWRGFDVSRD